jgi:Uma2 family endonuclease
MSAPVSSVGLSVPPSRALWYDYMTRGPWPELHDSDKQIEVVNGVEVEKQVGAWEIHLANEIHNALVAQARSLGASYVEMEFDLPVVGNVRKPDVAFVTETTWPRGLRIPPGRGWAVAPDLAVEVVSPYDLAHAVVVKLHEYFLSGVKMVWQVWPNVEQIYVFTSPTQVRILTRADELTGDPVVSGFRMPLADLFPTAAPTP